MLRHVPIAQLVSTVEPAHRIVLLVLLVTMLPLPRLLVALLVVLVPTRLLRPAHALLVGLEHILSRPRVLARTVSLVLTHWVAPQSAATATMVLTAQVLAALPV